MGMLDGKVIVVAGGGGIATGLVRRYAAEGAAVVIGDNHLDRAEALADEIAAAGARASAVRFDGGDEASIEGIVAHACGAFGALDGIHVNFYAPSEARLDSDVLTMPMAVFDRTMAVSARGFVLMTRAALPPMIERGGGAIIYMSSAAAHIAEPVLPAYAMAKASTHALARHVAAAYGPKGIRANVIAPGVIRHEGWDRMQPDHAEAREASARATNALKTRIGRPRDIAGISAVLMSDDGGFVTGQVISIDGGSTMRP